jgi:hypothetical protein
MFWKKKRAPAADAPPTGDAGPAPGAGGKRVLDARTMTAIMAAIAAYEGGEAASCELVVRKINRTAGPRTAWNLAGLGEAIDSRRV